MKNKFDTLLSVLNIVLSSLFAFAIAYATFIEQKYDSEYAKIMIYNARWMEVLLFLLGLTLLVSIFVRKLYKRNKFTMFLFHLGFIVMLIGAAFTRYMADEGTMHIREGQSSDILYSTETWLKIMPDVNDSASVIQLKMDRTRAMIEPVNETFKVADKGELKLEFKSYLNNAVSQINENAPDGINMLNVRVATAMGNVSDIIKDGEVKMIGGKTFAYNVEAENMAILIKNDSTGLLVSGPEKLYRSDMGGEMTDSIEAGANGKFVENQVYSVGETLFLLVKYYKKGKAVLVNGNPDNGKPDAILADLSYKGQKKEIQIFGGNGFEMKPQNFKMDDISVNIGYGNILIKLPFSLFLEDFVLERYPGSENPSSFKSDVVLIDERVNLKEPHKIYMNNVLDYDGYRFFQSSYDRDEKGTILSVNHDRPGTLITYFSYILLLIGFISGFFNKNSRINVLMRKIRRAHIERKAAVIFLFMMIGFSSSAFSQGTVQKTVSSEHADKFGHLVVQSFDGRFQPVHTLATDILHKIYKKNTIKVDGKGKLDAMQFYMDLMIDSEFWKHEKIIYIKEEGIQSIIGVTGKYASFNDFFNSQGAYKLDEYSEQAYQKDRSLQTKFDKEIMKVNERLNIFLMTTRGDMLLIFPLENHANNKWVSINDSASFVPLTGGIRAINEDLQLTVLNYNTVFQSYLQSVFTGIETNNWKRADQILGYISNIQRQSGSSDVIPNETKINTEVHYNKAQIFVRLKFIYMILSVFLLILTFVDHLRSKKSKLISYLVNIFVALLALAFLFHTYGLVLRWYLSGHAPWSNGYEALIFVAWGAILAGFIFIRFSKIVLAATSVLAFLIMMTAGFSTYDPQLTNLVPVLKSYWLIIHVAAIVISYGFLGLGFILGLMNLFMYMFKNTKNMAKLDFTIKDLSSISELVLIIGLMLATLGTFLGAVWANESWGRYWGWDPKETWALVILMVYSVVLHMRLVPSINNLMYYNIASVIGFGTVIMTFFGVNYYFSKGLHSYASGQQSAFPLWAWIAILSLLALITAAVLKERKFTETAIEETDKEE